MKEIKNIIQNITGLQYNYNNEKLCGGDVMNPIDGRFQNALILDFKSFYPSIIVSYDILGKGMSEWMLKMFQLRQGGDVNAKLLMNSVYGNMKHFDISKAREITQKGREWINMLRNYLSGIGYRVVYSHTDSVMIDNITDIALLMDNIKLFKCYLESKITHPNPILNINIESYFRWVYFKPKLTQKGLEHSANNYIGINFDNSWVMKGQWKPSVFETMIIDFIKSRLEKGIIEVSSFELLEYLKNSNFISKNERFINTKNLNILQIKGNVIDL